MLPRGTDRAIRVASRRRDFLNGKLTGMRHYGHGGIRFLVSEDGVGNIVCSKCGTIGLCPSEETFKALVDNFVQ